MHTTMRSLAAATILASLLASCSSSQTPPGVELPEVAIAQTLSQLDVFNVRGSVSVPYVIEIRNPNEFAIELDRVQLRTIGAGAYEMGDSVEVQSLVIPAGGSESFRFSVPAIATGGETSTNLPTTIRVTAYFDSPAGPFRRIITESVGGFAGTAQ